MHLAPLCVSMATTTTRSTALCDEVSRQILDGVYIWRGTDERTSVHLVGLCQVSKEDAACKSLLQLQLSKNEFGWTFSRIASTSCGTHATICWPHSGIHVQTRSNCTQLSETLQSSCIQSAHAMLSSPSGVVKQSFTVGTADVASH